MSETNYFFTINI